MNTVWAFVAYALFLYLLIVLARFVIDITRQFARAWRPAGAAAVGVELVYLATDPPIRLLRRLIPPVRICSVSLDLSIMILLIAILVLRWVALRLS